MSTVQPVRSLYTNKAQVWSTVGMWAWLLHRITGICLAFCMVLYMGLHTTLILGGSAAYYYTLKLLMGNPVFIILDFLLAFAVFYHVLNGIRLILFDFGVGYGRQKEIFWAFMGIGAVIYIVILIRVLQ